MKLSLYNYELLNFAGANAIISEKGIARIDSPAMFKLLKELKTVEHISKAELDALSSSHNLDPTDAYDFLKTAIRIEGEKDIHHFNSILIAHDWGETSNLEKILSGEIENLKVCDLQNFAPSSLNGQGHYVIILCSRYNYTAIKNLYFNIAKQWPTSAISVCYGNADLFYLSQPYIQSIGNPCHFCTVDKLISNEMHSSSNNTWTKLLDFCKAQSIDLPSAKLTLLQKSLLLGAIARAIRLVSGTSITRKYQDNILQGTTINISNGQITQVSATHWHSCDCLSIAQ
jgi:McbB family protein